MKKYLKYFEFFSFGMLNIFLSLGIVITPFLTEFYTKGLNSENDWTDVYTVILGIFFWFVFHSLKITTFAIINRFKTTLPNINKILNKLANVRNFRIKFLMYCLLFDIAMFLVLLAMNEFDFGIIYPYLFLGGGMLYPYMMFIFIYKKTNNSR